MLNGDDVWLGVRVGCGSAMLYIHQMSRVNSHNNFVMNTAA